MESPARSYTRPPISCYVCRNDEMLLPRQDALDQLAADRRREHGREWAQGEYQN